MLDMVQKMPVDENVAEKKDKTQVQLKKLTVPANEAATRRVALDEIQNFGFKNVAQKELKDAYWKKQPLGVSNSNFNYNVGQVKTTTTAMKESLTDKAKVAAVVKKKQKTETALSLGHKEEAIPALIALSSLRLADVEDIDAGDQEYVSDIYKHLYALEDQLPIKVNHLAHQLEVSSRMRAVLIDWLNEIHLQFQLVTETFHLAVAIIDRYLQVVNATKRQHFQLVGVTALFIAAKYEECRRSPVIADFVFIADNTYTDQGIRLMELKILKAIDNNLSRPLSIHFLRRFSKSAKAEEAHHVMSKYFLELTTLDYNLSSYKPSEIATASLYLSLCLLNGNARAATRFNGSHWTPTLMQHSRYTEQHLRPITRHIAKLAREAPHVKLKSTYSKYQANKFNKIALRSELSGPTLIF